MVRSVSGLGLSVMRQRCLQRVSSSRIDLASIVKDGSGLAWPGQIVFGVNETAADDAAGSEQASPEFGRQRIDWRLETYVESSRQRRSAREQTTTDGWIEGLE
jgi:hypothetical protein